MKKALSISFIVCFIATAAFAKEIMNEGKIDMKHSVRQTIYNINTVQEKEIDIADKFQSMFKDGKITGQIRSIYTSFDQKNSINDDTYATAIGGMLKYELASLNGFNAAIAFSASEDIGFATGDKNNHNNEFSSSSGSYSKLTESYINYVNGGLNIKIGRQPLDTPLADSDDIRMIQNTFESYLLKYQFSSFEILALNIKSWQGFDADLDKGWVDLGSKGVTVTAVMYSDLFDFRAWYYDINIPDEETKAVYLDAGCSINIGENTNIHLLAQFLDEKEKNNSGISARIYGFHNEFVINNLGFNIAYNHSEKIKGKRSFSGIGGGNMFTSMDKLIIDDIADDREVNAIVAGMTYRFDNFSFLYAYGNFKGEENSFGIKEHIVEQNIKLGYSIDEKFEAVGVYAMQRDKENSIKTLYDWNRMQISVKYNF